MCKKNELEIMMPEFLFNYLGINDNNIFKITHEDLKILIPEIKRCSFEELDKNNYLLYQGEVLLVKDFKGKVIPYYNPLKYLDIEIYDLEEVEKPSFKKDIEEINIDDLTNYELKKEYFKDRRLHKHKLCRMLKKEIEERNINLSRRKCKKNEKYRGDVDYD